MRSAYALMGLLFVVCVGCGSRRDGMGQGPVAAQKGAEAARENQAAPPGKEPLRKIVYTATVRLIVEDFVKAKDELADLLKAHAAYVISSDVSGTPGTPRSGEWKLRVPVDRFDAFQAAVSKLGELQKTNIDSQDVTDEFYDVEARIRNLEKEEGSLLELLQKSTGKLEDVLAVRREVARVRGDVERLQGRRQLLKALSDMATVTVFLHERGSYVPEESASFGTMLGRAFHGSITALVNIGQGLTIVLVALAPWLVLVGAVGVPASLFVRRHWRRRIAVVTGPSRQPESGRGSIS